MSVQCQIFSFNTVASILFGMFNATSRLCHGSPRGSGGRVTITVQHGQRRGRGPRRRHGGRRQQRGGRDGQGEPEATPVIQPAVAGGAVPEPVNVGGEPGGDGAGDHRLVVVELERVALLVSTRLVFIVVRDRCRGGGGCGGGD